MLFERIKSEGIAHNSYMVGSGNDAAVIDPRRDCEVYLDIAQRRGMRISHIFETHRNEDYVIGSAELQNLTGADVYHGPGLDWKYGNTLKDGQEFRIGSLRFTAIHTPGHTDESMCYALADPGSGKNNVMVFSGDTLFIGDVGRTDLYGSEEEERLASNLYDSLYGRVLSLGDWVILCPAHGGGSICGMSIGDRDESTLGLERLQNPALQLKHKSDFVRHKLGEKPTRPPYFSQMEKYNLEGPPLLGRLSLPPPLTPREFRTEMEKGTLVIDAGEPAAFGGAHIVGAYSIWLGGLPVFAGWVLPYDRSLLLVLEDHDPAHLDTAVRHLIRTGYDRIVGYLKGGTEGWYNAGLPVERLNLLSVHDLKAMLGRGENITVLDVRGQAEWESGHIPGARHIYVGHIEQRVSEVPKDIPVATLCGTGHRSGLAASILLRAGYQKVYNVLGSMTAWKAAGYPTVTD
ncbi:MAG: MBL fold metallo-hydrolase [Chloroflexi bacterium]|nr:MBL fold metallo-hydrolase [Chloroflexota bacterium]